MKALLSLVVVGLVAVAAFGAPVGYDAGTQTLTYGFGQDPAVAFQPAANIDPPVLDNVVFSYGGVDLATFRTLDAKVIDFNNALGAAGSGVDVVVNKVVAQIDANTAITFQNWASKTGGAILGSSGVGGRGRMGAYSGEFSYQCLSQPTSSSTNGNPAGADIGWNNHPAGLSYLDFDVASNSPNVGVIAIGFCLDGAGNLSDRNIGGSLQVQLSDGTITPMISYGDTNVLDGNKLFLGYQAPQGLTIAHVWCGKDSGGSGQAPVNVDDLSFVVVPEPATMGLLLIGGIGALLRRRNR